MNKEQKPIDPSDLPQQEVYKKQEVFQHPQPQDTGKPLNDPPQADERSDTASLEGKKTSKGAGLNEARSRGDAGAFEGFEDQSDG